MTHPACDPHDATPPRSARRVRRAVGVVVVRALALAVCAHASVALAWQSSGATAQLDFRDVFRRLDTTGLLLIALAGLVVLWFAWRIVRMIGGDRAPKAAPPRKTAPRGPVSAPDSPPPRDSLQTTTDWGFDENKRSAVGRRKGLSDDPSLTSIDTSTRLPSLERPTGSLGVIPEDALGRSPIATVSPYRTGGTNPYYLRGESLENQIDVEEVADVLTQAELLVQLGDPKEAMNLLSRHIRDTEKPGPQVWLMLLDLYRSTGRESQYNALGDGFRALFNAQVPPWTTTAGADRVLEDYPQVMQRVTGAWPTAECRAHLEALLNDDRGGSRQGFSLAAYRDILFLVDVLEARGVLDGEDSDRAEIARKLTIR